MTSDQTFAHLGERLAWVLEDKNISDAEVASACEVTRQAVNGWKRTGRIAKSQLLKLADLTGYPVSWWLGGSAEATEVSPAAARLLRAVSGHSEKEIEEIAHGLEILLGAAKRKTPDRGKSDVYTVGSAFAPKASERRKA
ncbi:helix-turn-helix domain-containing protein [Paraburkholderia sp. J11-2]|uniref:helix-turn-helix domain-containing protein n=1 Tax=Paraburkholderia sp. J11-2 TaxID=2805431 RepID=UPI002AB729B2|nr:helix-turn-helix domain-containing protein [Paraburkholderia sp. J11-2]